MTNSIRQVSPATVGRDAELAQLIALLTRAEGRERQLVLVTGEPGLGKSRLMLDASALALTRGFEVLAGQCHPGDRGVPLAPFVDAIRQRIGGLAVADGRAFLGSACPTLAGFIPEIASICTPGIVVGLTPELAQGMVFETVAGLLMSRAALRPVLLIIEDVQWADPTSFALLALLVRRTIGHRIALFVTSPADDPRLIADSGVATLRRLPDAREIRLQALDRSATDQLLAALVPVPPSAGFAAEVARRSGGNPLFVEELAAAHRPAEPFSAHDAGAVPPDLTGFVLRRLDELNRRDRAILELASIIGRDVSESFVAEAGGWPIDIVSDGFAAARRAGIVELPGGLAASGSTRWRFHHELTREAMYERIAPSRRRTLHGKVAAAMLASPDQQRGAALVDPATLGRHLHAAGDWPAALEQCRIAADRARRLHATHEALEHDRRALDAALALGDVAAAELHLQVGRDLAILGSEAEAETQFREAERRSRDAGSPDVRQAAIDERAGLAASRDYALAEQLAREGLELAEQAGQEPTVARSLNRLGNILTNGLRFAEGRAMHEDALARYRRVDDARGVADSLDLIAMTHYLGGELRQARDSFGRAAASFEELNDSERLASALTSRGLYLAVLDGACETDEGPDSYRADAERGLEMARAIGWRAGETYALAALACAALGAGRIATARARATDARAVAESIEHRQWTLLADFVAGLIDVAVHDATAASAHFESALELATATGSAQWADRLSAWVDRSRSLGGDRDARARLSGRVEHSGATLERIGERRALLGLAEVSLHDNPGGAVTILDGPDPSRRTEAVELLLLRGEALGLLGSISEANEQLQRAESIARAVGPRPLLWRIAAAQARLWLGHDADARTRALAVARRELGALAGTAGEADQATLLHSAEARTVTGPGRRRSGADEPSLTDRERQVAECVARGLRNKEIAVELGITAKTVEMHVANAIAKLELSSRASLAVWMTTEARQR